jgi:hypothetical protein
MQNPLELLKEGQLEKATGIRTHNSFCLIHSCRFQISKTGLIRMSALRMN